MNFKCIKQIIFAALLASVSFSTFAAIVDIDDGYEENDDYVEAEATGFFTIATDISAVSLDADWYKIDVSSSPLRLQIDLQFSDLDDDLELDLLNSAGAVIKSSVSQNDDEYIQYDVESAGIYYIQVRSTGNVYIGATYDLWWDGIPLPKDGDDNYESNNSPRTAHDFSLKERTLLSSTSTKTGCTVTETELCLGYGYSLDDDWYKIEVTSGYTEVQIEALFYTALSDINIYLYDETGTQELASATSTTDSEFITFNVGAAGIYLIKVTVLDSAFKDTPYDLWWDDVAAPETGSFGLASLLILPLLIVLRRKVRV